MKTCSRCKIKKSLDEYYKDTNLKSGLQSYCKSCAGDMQRRYQENNRDKVNSLSKKWREENKEKCRLQAKIRRDENKEEINRRAKERRDTPEGKLKEKEKGKIQRERHAEKIKERQKSWRERSKEHITNNRRRRVQENPEYAKKLRDDSYARSRGFKDYAELLIDRENRKKKTEKSRQEYFKNQYADVIEFKIEWNELCKYFTKENYKKRMSAELKEKRKTDIQYKLKDNLRARTRKILRIQSANKYTSMANLIGCSGKQLADYFLEKGYNPDTDTIDHYVPIGRFDLTIPEHQLVSCHYLNLQPLDSKINYAKSDMLVNGWEEKIYQICEVRNINPQPIINHIKETVKC